MTIGGMGLALELRRAWPTIRLNETHPKVLYRELTGKRIALEQLPAAVQWLMFSSKLYLLGTMDNDHQFDPVLSAWATRRVRPWLARFG